MKVDEKILQRFQELIDMGQQVLRTRRSRSTSTVTYLGDDAVDLEKSHQWGTSCLNLLSRVFGSNSDHYQRFNELYKNLDDFHPVQKAMGILKAAKEDYENEMLFNTHVLIEAEVFDDFLEQAQYLLDAGYYQAAGVIAGSVLEDGLRKLSIRAGIILPERPKLDTMNIELAKLGIYNKLVQKRVTALADVRNKAAHGQWDEFSSNDVEEMLRQVRAFMEEYFS